MDKLCKHCQKPFTHKRRKDAQYCSKACVYKAYNDKRPRKTAKSYFKAKELKSKHIPPQSLEVIYGTLMGDACLVLQTDSFHRISLCHSEKQKDYIEFKKKSIGDIFMQTTSNESITRYGGRQYHYHSISHKELTNIYGMIYINKIKTVTRKFLNVLTPTSLLFWYMDDGSMNKGSGYAIILHTCSFALPEVKIIKRWMWQKFGITAKISIVQGGYFPERKYYSLRFVREDTLRFLSVISTSPLFAEAIKALPYKFYPYYSCN